MKAYCENSEVCRQFCLLKHFDRHGISNKTTKHKCCDICLPLGKCDKYVESLQQQKLLGNDLSAGFSAEVIEQILVVCNEVNSVEDIHVRVDMWDFEFIVIWLVLHHSLFPPPRCFEWLWMDGNSLCKVFQINNWRPQRKWHFCWVRDYFLF